MRMNMQANRHCGKHSKKQIRNEKSKENEIKEKRSKKKGQR